MRNLLYKIKSELFFRLGLASIYLYSGWFLVTASAERLELLANWPDWASGFLANLGAENFLSLLGAFELALGGLFLLWFMPGRVIRWGALASVFHLTILFIFQGGLSLASFHYLGLIGLALGVWGIYRRRL